MTYVPGWLVVTVVVATAGIAMVLAFRRGGRAARWLAILAVPAAALLGASSEEFCETRSLLGSGCERYSAVGEALNWLAWATVPAMLLASVVLSIVRPAARWN